MVEVLSTFTGKAVASGRATVYASIASAMNALSGPLHGRANQACLEFVKELELMTPGNRGLRKGRISRKATYIRVRTWSSKG